MESPSDIIQVTLTISSTFENFTFNLERSAVQFIRKVLTESSPEIPYSELEAKTATGKANFIVACHHAERTPFKLYGLIIGVASKGSSGGVKPEIPIHFIVYVSANDELQVVYDLPSSFFSHFGFYNTEIGLRIDRHLRRLLDLSAICSN